MPRILLLLCGLVLFGLSAEVMADVVTDWNARTIAASTRSGEADLPTSRSLAIVQVAMFGAVNAVAGTYHPFIVQLTATPDVLPAVAASEAADRVLVWLYPAQQAQFDAARDADIAAVPDSTAKVDSLELGDTAAEQVIAWRTNDHVKDVVPYTPGTELGAWQPTPPDFAPALAPQWAGMTPFALQDDDQFRAAPPPVLSSADFIASCTETEALGALHSATRTADETDMALFWGDHVGKECSVGMLNDIARQVALRQNNTLEENARLFALLDVAVADALIAAWDTKYHYNTWRPITAIRNLGPLNNPALTADPTWEPLLPTPPFPEYVAAHSVFSSAGASILAHAFGDNQQFSATSDTYGQITRSYHSFSQMAEECGRSRIYGGVHFQFSNSAGHAMGHAIGEYVWAQVMSPIGE